MKVKRKAVAPSVPKESLSRVFGAKTPKRAQKLGRSKWATSANTEAAAAAEIMAYHYDDARNSPAAENCPQKTSSS